MDILERRDCPSFTFDLSAAGLFAQPVAVASLSRAASDIALSLPASTVHVKVGVFHDPGAIGRGTTGSVWFNPDVAWVFDTKPGTPPQSNSFYATATHELLHALGIGTAPAWYSQVHDGHFYGPESVALNGGPVPLAPDNAHWVEAIRVNGRGDPVDQFAARGRDGYFSPLDSAALDDIGVHNVYVDPSPAAQLPAPVEPFAGYAGHVVWTEGDTNGDGTDEWIAVATNGHVKVFDGATGALLVSRIAFEGYAGQVQPLFVDGTLYLMADPAPTSGLFHLKALDAAGNETFSAMVPRVG